MEEISSINNITLSHHRQCLVLLTPGMTVPQYMDVHQRPLYKKRVFCLSYPWHYVGVGVVA